MTTTTCTASPGRLLGAVLTVALVATACGSPGQSAEPDATAAVASGEDGAAALTDDAEEPASDAAGESADDATADVEPVAAELVTPEDAQPDDADPKDLLLSLEDLPDGWSTDGPVDWWFTDLVEAGWDLTWCDEESAREWVRPRAEAGIEFEATGGPTSACRSSTG